MGPDDSPHVCGDDIPEADKLAVEAMPEGYGQDEYDAGVRSVSLTFRREGDCLIWTRGKTGSGYGAVKVNGRMVAAHRLAWELANGCEIPDGMVVRHKCDTRLCINPDHLEVGTQADNIADCVERGRHRNQYREATHCVNGHPFDEENTYRNPNNGRRHCRTCTDKHRRAYAERKRQEAA